MKNFDNFMKDLPAADIATKVQQAVQNSIENTSNNVDALTAIISTVSVQVTLSILSEYHKWLEQ